MNRLAAAVLAGALLAAPALLQAQSRPRVGPQISYEFNGDDLGFGGRLEHSLAGLLGTAQVGGAAEANWFPGTADLFDLSYSLIFSIRNPSIDPYAGGGLNLAISSGSGRTGSDLHLNAVGGLRFGTMGVVTPFVQLRYVFVSGDNLIVTGGILF